MEQLPSTNGGANTLSGDSYDNTAGWMASIGATSEFVEQFAQDGRTGDGC